MPPFRSIIPWSIMPSGEPMPSISLKTGGQRLEGGSGRRREGAVRGGGRSRKGRRDSVKHHYRGEKNLSYTSVTALYCRAGCILCQINFQPHYFLLLASFPVCKQPLSNFILLFLSCCLVSVWNYGLFREILTLATAAQSNVKMESQKIQEINKRIKSV